MFLFADLIEQLIDLLGSAESCVVKREMNGGSSCRRSMPILLRAQSSICLGTVGTAYTKQVEYSDLGLSNS